MKTLTEIKELSDCNLLEHLCSSENEEAAYNEFVKRFIKDCQQICRDICSKRKLDNHVGQQIVSDTFEKVRRYKSFQRISDSNQDERTLVVKFLYRVALNLFNDYYNNTKKSDEPYSTYIDELAISASAISDLKQKKEVAELLLKKLTAKERKVLLADIEYKKHHKYLPSYVVGTLSIELNVKPSTIRKIRERAVEKIKKAIDDYNEQ